MLMRNGVIFKKNYANFLHIISNSFNYEYYITIDLFNIFQM